MVGAQYRQNSEPFPCGLSHFWVAVPSCSTRVARCVTLMKVSAAEHLVFQGQAVIFDVQDNNAAASFKCRQAIADLAAVTAASGFWA